MTYHNPCTHGETETSVIARWMVVERRVLATPEDDHFGQMSLIRACADCGGPARAETCTRCTS